MLDPTTTAPGMLHEDKRPCQLDVQVMKSPNESASIAFSAT
jgi:hypothetical protein